MIGQFRKEDYDEAIRRLQEGAKQLEMTPWCEICSGDCWAGNCRFNPLVAFAYCEETKRAGEELAKLCDILENPGRPLYRVAETLPLLRQLAEWMRGHTFHLGSFSGPGSVVSPWAERMNQEREQG